MGLSLKQYQRSESIYSNSYIASSHKLFPCTAFSQFDHYFSLVLSSSEHIGFHWSWYWSYVCLFCNLDSEMLIFCKTFGVKYLFFPFLSKNLNLSEFSELLSLLLQCVTSMQKRQNYEQTDTQIVCHLQELMSNSVLLGHKHRITSPSK